MLSTAAPYRAQIDREALGIRWLATFLPRIDSSLGAPHSTHSSAPRGGTPNPRHPLSWSIPCPGLPLFSALLPPTSFNREPQATAPARFPLSVPGSSLGPH